MKYERGITHIAVVEFISYGSVFHMQFNVAFVLSQVKNALEHYEQSKPKLQAHVFYLIPCYALSFHLHGVSFCFQFWMKRWIRLCFGSQLICNVHLEISFLFPMMNNSISLPWICLYPRMKYVFCAGVPSETDED